MILNPTKQTLLDVVKNHHHQLIQFHVHRPSLFGSVARNEAHQGSDIDLLVEFKAGYKTYDNFINLAYFLEDALQCRVELVTAASLSPYLRTRIMRKVEDVFIGM